MQYLKYITIILLLISGCDQVSDCKCGNDDCGSACRLQCTDVNCTPGTPCCSKCTCDPLKK